MQAIRKTQVPVRLLAALCAIALAMGMMVPCTASAADTCTVKFGTTSEVSVQKGGKLSQSQIPVLEDIEITIADGVAKGQTVTANFRGWLLPSRLESFKSYLGYNTILKETPNELVRSGSSEFGHYESDVLNRYTQIDGDMTLLALYTVDGICSSELSFVQDSGERDSEGDTVGGDWMKFDLGFIPKGFSVTEEVLAPYYAETQAKFGNAWKPSDLWSLTSFGYSSIGSFPEGTFHLPLVGGQSLHAALYGKFVPADSAAPGVTPTEGVMYRLYNPNSGEHFYTSNEGEKDNLVSLGWDYEGEGWKAPASGAEVFRLYNAAGGEHHYTTNAAEKDALVGLGWDYEGVGWYSESEDGIGLMRLYNPNAFANNHHYTTDENEKGYLISIGWQDEGIGWYGVK